MRSEDVRGLVSVAVVATVVIGAMSLVGSHDSTRTAAADATAAPSTVVDATAATAATTLDTAVDSTTAGSSPTTDEVTVGGAADDGGCIMVERSVNLGSSGPTVECLQTALKTDGIYTGAVTGVYDDATYAAVKALQLREDLFVDGLAGRETGLFLGIWPDEESLVVRTPAPAPGAVDLLGYPMSTVSSAGADAPPLPPDSGSGRRLVYSRAGQRIWAVDEDGQILRSWLISGSKYGNETPGTHQVYSRSEVSTAWNGKAYLPQMVRWLKTDIGAIGMHSIPIHVSDNTVYQTEAELGTRLSGGCQRQAPADADFVWAWADIGTVVVVV
ncbi:MAG: peptidoglycan-binding protein [Actinobacteria bacterium]|nr:peptidoglycan-binding protein [Actinomycetota bacterium]